MNRKNYLPLLFSLLALFGCKEIVEPDISSKNVKVITPANGYQSSSINLTFWWDELKGASQYKLQLVKSSFASIQQIIFDTVVSKTKFSWTLDPGTYEWRIRAENGSYQTTYVTYSLSVDSSLSLTNQSILLLSPSNNYISAASKHKFKWNGLSSAEDYRFEIYSLGSVLYSNPAYIQDTISYSFPADGTYKWRVRAQNSSSVSPYSEYTISIDGTAPNTPTLSFPLDGDSTSFSIALGKTKAAINLNWDRGITSGTLITDSLFVYQLSGSILTYKIKTATTNTAYADSLAAGLYYWDVRSIDAAGNKSSYSNANRFKIK